VKAEKFEGHTEATKALALSVAGVMVAMVMWSFMMLLFYWRAEGRRAKRGRWLFIATILLKTLGMVGRLSIDLASMRLRSVNQDRGSTMAKRKKQSSKVQKKKGAKAHAKAKKAAGKATKRVVAKAKPKRAAAKKAAPPVAAAVESVTVIEQPTAAE
jgi:hypothetical protein